jgi:hypothetical protein
LRRHDVPSSFFDVIRIEKYLIYFLLAEESIIQKFKNHFYNYISVVFINPIEGKLEDMERGLIQLRIRHPDKICIDHNYLI